MKRIALISCVSKKLNRPAVAINLYVSSLFKWSVAYAREHELPILILSAKYGVVEPAAVIEPYNETLKTKTKVQREEWYSKVATDLAGMTPCEFVVLAGKVYSNGLVDRLPGCKFEFPLKGLGIGRRLQWLKKHAR